MTDAIIEFFQNSIPYDFITVIIISMIPLIELRGSIPVAIAMGMNPFFAFLCAWAGSVIIAPILLLILQPILKWMKKYKPFRSLANAVESIFKGKASLVETKAQKALDAKKVENRELFGVFAFVAIPIPLTGVWTGSAVASFMELGFWKSFLMVSLGNLVAGGIITLLSYFLADYIDIILYVLFAIVLIALIFYIIKLVMHMKQDKKIKENNRQEDNYTEPNSDTNNLEENIIEEQEEQNDNEKLDIESDSTKSKNSEAENKKN